MFLYCQTFLTRPSLNICTLDILIIFFFGISLSFYINYFQIKKNYHDFLRGVVSKVNNFYCRDLMEICFKCAKFLHFSHIFYYNFAMNFFFFYKYDSYCEKLPNGDILKKIYTKFKRNVFDVRLTINILYTI